MINSERKQKRYQRLYKQLQELLTGSPSAETQMATINAIIYHKISYAFWTGFYLLSDKRLIVGPYQGPLACQELEYPYGACWFSLLHKKSLMIPDVGKFPDHISCDSRSKSEIVIPVWNSNNEIIGVFDMDSDKQDAFDSDDLNGLERIIGLLKPG